MAPLAPIDGASAQGTSWTLDELCHVIETSGGSLKASHIKMLYDKDAQHQPVILAAGGLKKFCMSHAQRVEWVQPNGPGTEEIHIKKPAKEARKKRIARVAAAFAGALPDYVTKLVVSQSELKRAWISFCTDKDEVSSGFGPAIFLLKRWRALTAVGSGKFKLQAKTNPNFKKRHPQDRAGAVEGERPPSIVTNFISPVPEYAMPGEFLQLSSQGVYTMQKSVFKLLSEDKGFTPKKMTPSNFREYQHALLFTEELQMKYDISLYDLEITDKLTISRGLHKIFVGSGLAEKRPSVLRGDAVLLKYKQGKFVGYVHNVLLEDIEVSFDKRFANNPPFTVHFDFQRTPLRTMHRAVDELSESLVSNEAISLPKPAPHAKLNTEQRLFLSAALKAPQNAKKMAPPYFLWGPPGTGKTTTVVHTVLAILQGQPSAKILLAAPSNPAADLLCERLGALGVNQKQMLRLVAVTRDPRNVTKGALKFTRMDSVGAYFTIPSIEDLKKQRVVVATCSCAAYIRSSLRKQSDCWFTHVFVDEAAQALEAEALIPLTLRLPTGKLFLAGDFKQLGPVVRSPVALEFGLETSLMQRLVENVGVDHSRVFTLLDTYRAHPSILKLYNKTVYAGVLKCCSPESSKDMEKWPECPRDGSGHPHPLIFHHCDGEESRGNQSPSWQNVAEINTVKMYLMKLLAYGVKPADIGIISPYHKQCQRLRWMCLGEGVDIEIGTTELFQGREKRVIIISTVRSRQQDQVQSDLKFSLGFLGSYKRTNVALSRAKSLLVVVGNMSLLSNDATWNTVIKMVASMKCLRGEKFKVQQPIYGQGSEWGQQRSALASDAYDGVVDRPWRDHS
eukprot:gnl/MRDRNA2_/MRDRNA2_86899_c0_seq1.p1 gnl/MRDRNA2_/MRDRNA2_86899_c0~~gnl/MRDRNA2_/MRDRNA2_86899_c0_seq1.p1  ORF type:complete len:874 (+),score=166.74 gnl/MRDRNA2_/MRDRNA2_86899_c0_seq1:85-2622(+)